MTLREHPNPARVHRDRIAAPWIALVVSVIRLRDAVGQHGVVERQGREVAAAGQGELGHSGDQFVAGAFVDAETALGDLGDRVSRMRAADQEIGVGQRPVERSVAAVGVEHDGVGREFRSGGEEERCARHATT